ncbi:dynein 8 kDa light chain, flagellar outer arm-like [Oxyura jamaicensis]|uniref:dynein 8 kDa light chain, flagellar outer arm-like n=1 Tax=Oxyura jamaicensis TaxID=8884 RepID=UPI0015A6FBF9|nr:dynein 8 kDa light chain, flagellar outer arm-like [Oxyura jamaicensis]
MGKQKAVAKDTDVSEEVQRQALECTVLAMEKYSLEREIVALIKSEFEKKHSPTWHCVVGRTFGSSVSHETQHLIFSLVRGLSVLLFKAG